MSSVVISGDTSGAITLQAPAVAGSTTLNLPASSGTVLTQNSSAPANSFVVDASGNVGVGTSSPTSQLSVGSASGGSSTPTAIQMDNSFNTGASVTSLKHYLYKATGEAYGFGLGSSADIQYWAGSTSGGQHSFYTSSAERLRIDSSGNLRFNSGYGSAALAYGCRAWVNFNGTGTVAIRGSGNVSSITDNGTGRFQVNFSTAMPDTNYSAAGSNDHVPAVSYGLVTLRSGTILTTSVELNTFNQATAIYDPVVVNVAIFR